MIAAMSMMPLSGAGTVGSAGVDLCPYRVIDGCRITGERRVGRLIWLSAVRGTSLLWLSVRWINLVRMSTPFGPTVAIRFGPT